MTKAVAMISSSGSRTSAALFGLSLTALAIVGTPASVRSQTTWDPNAIAYEGPSSWQQAAVAALNRHLPTDSGYFVLGPLNLDSDLPDTLDLVRTTLRIIAPDPSTSRNLARRLWLPTGGVALEELQPSDTLPHELPPGYSGRFLKGTIVGERVYVQAFTIQEHRWLLWAQRAQIADIRDQVAGPLARFSRAVGRYLAAVDSGRPTPGPPVAAEYGLEPLFDLYHQPPEPVIRGRAGYLDLLARNRAFSLGGVSGVYGLVAGPGLMSRLEEEAEPALFRNKEGEVALQHRYRDFSDSGGSWAGRPILTPETLSRLVPGVYAYIVDRYGFIRVGAVSRGGSSQGGVVTPALLAHGDPVHVAGELVVRADSAGFPRVREVSVNSEEYFFSNLSSSLYADVQERSDRYVRALAHFLRALEAARIPRDRVLLRKF